MLVRGRRRVVGGALEGMAVAYGNEETDEFVQPTVIEGTSRVKDGDVVVFFNFRPDRARQLTQAFVDDDFNRFPTANIRVHFVTMTDYGDQFKVPVAFRKEVLTETFGEVIARYGLSQLRIAETEKYAHVTYFFSGGREKPFPGEDRCLIPSPTVETYDLQPEMSAPAVTEEVVARIDAQRHDVIILNYANADMVGHTGVWEATVRAVETVDACIGTVVKAVQAVNGIIMIISDHGNAEEMVEQGVEKTAHTLNPVPCILIGRNVRLNDGILGDVAPTLLALLGKPQPERMTGTSLIAKES
jgi:2,3-bisphosphoglycerate-independent phosphoglycerate mutase